MREAAIWEVLAGVPDPEIPVVSIVDLGIVRAVSDHLVTITPTYSGCPATAFIERSVREALDASGYRDVKVETTLSPPWTTDWISDAGRRKLRDHGIAPPCARRDDARPVPCPRCASGDTAQVSEFGSTPCKAAWKCNACLEPFELFKCL